VAELNVQNQQRIEWPAKLVVAKAYLDQLERSKALPQEQIAAVRRAIQSAESSGLARKDLANLKTFAAALKETARTTKSEADAKRLEALAQILERPSK
jgi:ribosomal protein S13